MLRQQLTASDTAGLALALVLCATVGLGVPALYDRYYSKDIYSETLGSDPPIGSSVALPNRDVQARPLKEQPILALYLGECQSCSVNYFEPSKLTYPKSTQVVLIFRARLEEIDKSFLNLPDFLVYADPDRKLSSQLNARWTPRMALLTSDCRISWLQPRPREFPSGVNYGP